MTTLGILVYRSFATVLETRGLTSGVAIPKIWGGQNVLF